MTPVFVLTDEQKNDLDKLASIIEDVYDIAIPVQDIEEIVHVIGGAVKEYAGVGNGISESNVCKTGDMSFCITVAPKLSGDRRTMEIAREIGCLFLDMGFRTDPQKWRTQKIGESICPRMEQLVRFNYFAQSLMMPKAAFYEALGKHKTEDNMVNPNLLAKEFNVPYSSVILRGRGLGFDW